VRVENGGFATQTSHAAWRAESSAPLYSWPAQAGRTPYCAVSQSFPGSITTCLIRSRFHV
jgi:hypothetical protein